MSWYTGPTVLEILEQVEVSRGRADDLDFRFPVQYVIREHAADYRGYAGRIKAGSVRVGERISVAGGREAQVSHIDIPDGEVEQAATGESVVLCLADDVVRGDLLAGGSRPEGVTRFAASVVGLSQKGLRAGQRVRIRYGTSEVRGKIAAVEPPRATFAAEGGPGRLELNEVAQATIQVAEALPVEDYAARGAVGSFLVVDQGNGDTLAAGLVGTALSGPLGEQYAEFFGRPGAPQEG